MNDYSPQDTVPVPVKLRIEDYIALDEAGAFDRYAKTELLAGELFYMNAQHRRHAYLKNELAYRLRRALEAIGSNLYVLTEATIAIPDQSAPAPDIILAREPQGAGFVPSASIALLVEVADTTLASDLGRKATIYAAAGIPEYWVIDVDGRTIHQMSASDGDAYRTLEKRSFGEALPSDLLGITIDTSGF